VRPYRTLGLTYRNYSVEVIWHDYEFIYFHLRPDDFCIRPFLIDYPAHVVQRDLSIRHVAK